MTLDPQVAAYLDQVRALGVLPPNDVPLEVARRAYDDSAPTLFGPAARAEFVHDDDATGVPVRVYRASDRGDAAVLYLHGGGWVLGGLQSHDPLCHALTARSGCTLIAVDYRLAPEHPYPAAVEDAWTALRWAAARFRTLAVAGDSAGGQLAAVMARRARDAALALRLQALIYPATDYAPDTRSYRENSDSRSLSGALMRWFWDQYVTDPSRAAEPDCSPLRASDLSGLAPALVLTAEYDPLRDEAEAYGRRLEQAGVPLASRRYDGLIHGFIRMPALIDRAREAIDHVAAALKAALQV